MQINPFKLTPWDRQPALPPFGHITPIQHTLKPAFRYMRPVLDDANQVLRVVALAVFKRIERFHHILSQANLDVFNDCLMPNDKLNIDLNKARSQLLAELMKADKLSSGFHQEQLLVKMFVQYAVVDMLGVMMVRSVLAHRLDISIEDKSILLNYYRKPSDELISLQPFGLTIRLIKDIKTDAGEVNILIRERHCAVLYFWSQQVEEWLDRDIPQTAITNLPINKQFIHARDQEYSGLAMEQTRTVEGVDFQKTTQKLYPSPILTTPTLPTPTPQFETTHSLTIKCGMQSGGTTPLPLVSSEQNRERNYSQMHEKSLLENKKKMPNIKLYFKKVEEQTVNQSKTQSRASFKPVLLKHPHTHPLTKPVRPKPSLEPILPRKERSQSLIRIKKGGVRQFKRGVSGGKPISMLRGYQGLSFY